MGTCGMGIFAGDLGGGGFNIFLTSLRFLPDLLLFPFISWLLPINLPFDFYLLVGPVAVRVFGVFSVFGFLYCTYDRWA